VLPAAVTVRVGLIGRGQEGAAVGGIRDAVAVGVALAAHHEAHVRRQRAAPHRRIAGLRHVARCTAPRLIFSECGVTCACPGSNLADMSIPVELERVRDEIALRGGAPYLLTVSSDGRPHAVSGSVEWSSGALLGSVGRRTAENIAERPLVSLLWPPAERGGYSLIVDATASLEGAGEAQRARFVPTRGVLHRPAAEDRVPAPGCSADCVPLLR
jgi:hypothetical protein